MTTFAVGLVLLSACFHAAWNFVAKKAGGGAGFVWLFGVFEIVLFLPFVMYAIIAQEAQMDFTGLVFMVGGAILHLAYFLLLVKGYQVGDLSIVYPLARAIGPFIATIAAILFLGERPTPLALTGGLLICGGVFWLTGDPRKLRRSDALPGVAFAGLTGLAIAGYTLWDAVAVNRLLLPPLMFQWGLGAFRTLLLTPYVLKNWDGVMVAWARDKWKASFVSIFSFLAYLLILFALVISPVSYVAPMRVISTLIGVMMGTRFLGEQDPLGRLSAAGAMVLGVIALSVG